MTMDIWLARLINASLVPALLLCAAWDGRTSRHDHTLNGIMTVLGVWLIVRLWKAFDSAPARPYQYRTLKLLGLLLLFSVVGKVVQLVAG